MPAATPPSATIAARAAPPAMVSAMPISASPCSSNAHSSARPQIVDVICHVGVAPCAPATSCSISSPPATLQRIDEVGGVAPCQRLQLAPGRRASPAHRRASFPATGNAHRGAIEISSRQRLDHQIGPSHPSHRRTRFSRRAATARAASSVEAAGENRQPARRLALRGREQFVAQSSVALERLMPAAAPCGGRASDSLNRSSSRAASSRTPRTSTRPAAQLDCQAECHRAAGEILTMSAVLASVSLNSSKFRGGALDEKLDGRKGDRILRCQLRRRRRQLPGQQALHARPRRGAARGW